MTVRAAVAGLAVSLTLACGSTEPPQLATQRGLPAHSVQLHIHGSFSEGVGSFESHGFEARDVGVDVIWWSDHDFRIASYRHLSRYGFESPKEPIDRGEPWRARLVIDDGNTKGIRTDSDHTDPAGEHGFSERSVEGEASLWVALRSDAPSFHSHLLSIEAHRSTHRRSLAAGVTLELAIFAEALGPDACAIVEVLLSEHPDTDGVMRRHALRYWLGADASAPWREGTVWNVPVAWQTGAWNRIVLPLTRDAIAGFPEIDGEDNSLNTLLVGVAARRGARAMALFDDLRIVQERAGRASFAKYGEMIDAVTAADPQLVQLRGQEISYASGHFNEFSVHPELRDIDAVIDGSGILRGENPKEESRRLRDYSIGHAVREIHARGGLVSYNHVFGAAFAGGVPDSIRTRETVLARLVRKRLSGADLLEVGYRDRGGHSLRDHLWVWDELAKQGLFPVGVGVSDSHGGGDQRWRTSPNNFVTWIYAASPSATDLIEGLRSGAVFFGDLTRFDGTVDLVTADGARMGQIVVTDRDVERVAISVRGLEAGDELIVVESGEMVMRHVVKNSTVALEHDIALAAEGSTTVRIEVRDQGGVAKVFSNPLIFVRQVPEGGIVTSRRGPSRIGN